MVIKVLLLAGWLGIFSNTKADQIQEQLDQCVLLINNDSTEQAKQIIDSIVIEFGSNLQKAKYHQLKGYCLHINNQLLDALKNYNYALDYLSQTGDDHDGMKLALLKNKGDILTIYKDYREAYNSTEKALEYIEILENDEKIKEKASILFNLGRIKYMEKSYEEAITIFSESQVISPRNRNLNAIGLCYLGKEEFDQAISYFQKVISESKDTETIGKAWHNLALAMVKSGRSGAESNFIEALKLKSGKHRIRTLREYGKYAITEKNDLVLAINLLEEAKGFIDELPNNPEFNEIYHWMNVAYAMNNDLQNSLNCSNIFYEKNNTFLEDQKELREKELQFQLMMAQREYEMEKKLASTIDWYDRKITYQVLISLMLLGFIAYRIVSWYYTKKSLEKELQRLF